MKRFKKILVAIDTRVDDHPIVDEAAQLAKQNGASLSIVDVVPEFPWMVRMMVSEHQELRKTMGREKSQKLEELASKYRDQGIDANAKVLWGKTSVEIVREVLRGRHDLVLRVAKGHESRRKGHFGTTGRALMRDCPCAVWLVSAEVPAYDHVLGCVDTSTGDPLDSELNDKVFELAAAIGEQHDAQLSIAHAWQVEGEQFLEGRMAKSAFDRMREDRKAYVNKQLNQFLQQHDASAGDQNVHLIKGEAADVIPAFAKQNGVDLIVMGTVARSGAAGVIMGNTAERILNRIECSVMALKPDTFVSPITAGEYIDIFDDEDSADAD